uniref:Uncharacterized protein n=1 Tax=Oryza meridionalis TaxID=40149 RepID=A0A0E0D4J0_9ORYZ
MARLRVAAGSFLEREGETRRTRKILVDSRGLDVDSEGFEPSPFHTRSVPVRQRQQQLVQGMESHTGITGVALKISHYLLNYAAMSRGVVNDSI